MATDINTHSGAMITQVGNAADGETTETDLPLIAGTAAAFATVDVYDSATLLGVVQANGQGAWSLQLSTPLFNGIHDLSAVQAADYEGDRIVNYFAVAIDAHDERVTDREPVMSAPEPGASNGVPYFPPNHFKTRNARPGPNDFDTKGDHRVAEDAGG
jgi:hypothetical protein